MSSIIISNGPPFRLLPVHWRVILCIGFALLTAVYANSQTCTLLNTSNTIDVENAQCAGTVATIRGSNPLGGNGLYSYQWEKGSLPCGSSAYTPIPGATNRDYAVPSATTSNDCFRRVVTSGTCTSVSGTVRVMNNDRTTPPMPTATVLGSTCTAGSGTITFTSPLPAAVTGYSINGTTYSNITGLFAGLPPDDYTLTVRYPAGCISPSRTVTIAPLVSPSGSISPSSASICAGSSQVLTISGGNSYQWYLNNTAIPGATGNTYIASVAGTYTADIIVGVCNVPASNSSVVTVNPLPTGSITPASVTICANSSTTLTTSGGVSYQWFRNNQIIGGATTSGSLNVTLAGTYAVEITNSAGCKARASNEATVTVTPLPNGAVTPANGTICGTGSITLTTSGGSSYQWYRNNSPITNATNATYAATQGGTYTVEITANGCKAFASNSAVITQGTVPSGSISPSSGTICTGASISLTATGGTSYQWSRDGTPIAGATSATYSATQAGTYTVVIFNGGCSASASNNAVITQALSPSGFITPASASICPGKSVVLTAVTAGGGISYQWFFNGGFIAGANSSTITASQTGNYSVILSNATCNSSASNIVTISPNAAITFNTPTTQPGCTSTTGSIKVTGVTGGGASVYSYSKDNGTTYQSSDSFGGLAVGNYQIVVRDTAGCVSSPRQVAIQAFVPTLAATATPGQATCELANGSVVITATGGTAPYNYRADNGAYQASNTLQNLSAGNHTATVRDAAGCTFNVSFVITNVGTPPNLLITNPAKVCPNGTANLQAATVTAGSEAGLTFTYWRDATATQSLATSTAVRAGTYYIKATKTGGCFAIKPVIVSEYVVTPGTITISGGDTSACFGEIITLTASTGTAFQWYRNGVILNGSTASSIRIVGNGAYSVAIRDSVCFASSRDTVNLTFIDCSVFEPAVFVPTGFTPNRNGANDVLRPLLKYAATLTHFKVYNRWGQQVFQTSTIGQGWDGNYKGAAQPAETYIWMIEFVGRNGATVKKTGRTLLIR